MVSFCPQKKTNKKKEQDGFCPWCAQLSQIIPVQNPQATNRFLTNQFMSFFHAEILSAPHIPVKDISIHSHVPVMTHILLEQALGSLEKKNPTAACLGLLSPGCALLCQRSSWSTGDNY